MFQHDYLLKFKENQIKKGLNYKLRWTVKYMNNSFEVLHSATNLDIWIFLVPMVTTGIPSAKDHLFFYICSMQVTCEVIITILCLLAIMP